MFILIHHCTEGRARLDLQTSWSSVLLLPMVVQHGHDKIHSKWKTGWQTRHNKKGEVNDICIVLMAVTMYSCNIQGECWSQAEMWMLDDVAALVLLPRHRVEHARLKCRCPPNSLSHSLSFWRLIKIANQFWNTALQKHQSPIYHRSINSWNANITWHATNSEPL